MRKVHFYLNYPDAKNIIVCGDIHGEFNTLVNKLCVQYRMTDTVLIVAGDCGFGFHKPGPNLACNFYWENEPPVFDDVMLETVGKKYSIDTVISHTAPSFCELKSKGMLEKFAEYDPTLLEDVQKERSTMDKIFNRLIGDGHPLDNWLYGHFHQSKNEIIDGVHFRMLDIMEFSPVV